MMSIEILHRIKADDDEAQINTKQKQVMGKNSVQSVNVITKKKIINYIQNVY